MSMSWPKPGRKSVGEYQLPGNPLVVAESAAAKTVTLGKISRAINITTDKVGCSIHFHDFNPDTGAALDTEFELPAGLTRLELRVKKFTVTPTGGAKFSVCVELTDIDTDEQQRLPTPFISGSSVA